MSILAHKESNPETPGGTFLSAILFQENNGRDGLDIVEVRDHHFHVIWSSLGNLKSLGVVSPRNLEHIISKEDQHFTFWGCNPHDCGGISGRYISEIFQISSKNMTILDVRQCASGDGSAESLSAKICATNLNNSAASLSPATEAVVTNQIRSKIVGSIEF